MEAQDLKEYKEKLSQLTEEEQKQRNLHLKGLADGTIQGPEIGFASIDKPWLKYYQNHAITTDVPKKTAYELIYEKNVSRQDYIALNYLGVKITYKELFENIEKLAKSFKKMGIKKGDIVTMALPSCPEMVYTFYALNKIGAITNSIDPRLKADGLINAINDTSSKYIIALDMCVPSINEIIDQVEIEKVVTMSPVESLPFPVKTLYNLKNKKTKLKDNNKQIFWKEFKNYGKNYVGITQEEYEKDYPATIVHTGGTTGKPKGVVLTNDNFNAMAITQEVSGYNMAEKDKFLTFLPPFIAYCLVNAIHDPLYLGFENTLVPTFEPNDFPKLMQKYKPNHVLAGPILWNYFIKSDLTKNMDLSFLKSPISGGDALNPELEREINAFFESHNCKCKVAQGYGMTEVSAAAVYSKEEANQEGSVGIPYVKNVISVFEPGTDIELAYNQPGEICISTPTQMKGYLNNPSATSEVIKLHDDGKNYVHTGDIGRIDENGNIRIDGRMKRMIVRSGNKIFPSTIEEIILSNDAVDNCAVVAMPNEVERHVPVAHIILKEEYIGQEGEVLEQISTQIVSQMPQFNLPYKFIFRKEIPLTNINKVDFKVLETESLDYVNEEGNIIINDDEKEIPKRM